MIRAYCCDVGGPSNVGWVRVYENDGQPQVEGGRSMAGFVAAIGTDLDQGAAVALGFESPLFVPIPVEAQLLSRGRDGDGNRSIFAPAGGYVALLGLHLAAWTLQQLRRPGVVIGLDVAKWRPEEPPTRLLIWEAFVSGPAHTTDGDHRRDAATAAVEFLTRYRLGASFHTDVVLRPKSASLSLAACAALWAGWTTDLKLLRSSVAVVKPAAPYSGPIRDMDPP